MKGLAGEKLISSGLRYGAGIIRPAPNCSADPDRRVHINNNNSYNYLNLIVLCIIEFSEI
jgi:hypothetical protein